MKTLKTLALIGASALAVSAVSTAAAQAQPYGGYGHGHAAVSAQYPLLPDNDSRRLSTGYVNRLDARVVAAARARQISWGEARDLRSQLSYAHGLAYRVQTRRADRMEIRRLDNVLDRVEAAVSHYAYNDRDRDYRWRH